MSTESTLLAMESAEESMVESPKRFFAARVAFVVAGAAALAVAGAALMQHGVSTDTGVDGIIEMDESHKPCGTDTVSICEEPFVLCAQAKCIASAFSTPSSDDVGLNLATCNCSYMGKTMSAGTKWSSPDHPAAFTNKPFKQICQYMRQLPERGYVLSTFTNQRVEYNWPKTLAETGAYTCHSEDTVTAQCDGAVCQVMDEVTWTPKLNKDDWKAGDPAVCTCPTVKGPKQTIAGSLMANGECYANGAGHPDGPSCVPKQTSAMNTYEVMVGAMSGGIPELDELIASCGAPDVQTPICKQR